jgi:MinD superfamily P-loop ATPase
MPTTATINVNYTIAVASGKGGTGKTTVAVNLFNALKNKYPDQIQLVDCDVEEPNALIFFENARPLRQQTIDQYIPVIDTLLCTFCKKCVAYCEFNAITVIAQAKFAAIDPQLCHSCGACLHACQFDAITEHPQQIGKFAQYQAPGGGTITTGTLNIGSAIQTMLIRKTKEESNIVPGLTLLDAPPGTSCPVVQTLADCQYVVLVTEPTPFGFHDLKLMIDLVIQMGLPFGVIINKAGLGNNEVAHYLSENDYELLGEIPFLREFAANYSKGKLLENIPDNIKQAFEQIANNISTKISKHQS